MNSHFPQYFLAGALMSVGAFGCAPAPAQTTNAPATGRAVPKPKPFVLVKREIGKSKSAPFRLVVPGKNGALTYKPYANAGETNAVNTVPDFSYGGYGGGGVAIPDIPARGNVEPGEGDDGARIQAAIDAVSTLPLGADGFRGAVEFGAGTYEVGGSLKIRASGVVLRGAGQGTNGTRIIATGPGDDTRHLIDIEGKANPTEIPATRQVIADAFVPTGALQITVARGADFAPGDAVMVQRTPNQAWIDAIDMKQFGWTPQSYIINYERVVQRVDGNRLTLDAPMVCPLEARFGGGAVFKTRDEGRLKNVGVERLRLESTYAGEEDENHAWDGVWVRYVENGWVREVTAQYFAYSAVHLRTGARHFTVQDCAMLDAKSDATGGRRYSFCIEGTSNGNLVQRCYARGGRHDYVIQSRVPGPNTFLDCVAEGALEDIGPHHRWSTGSLNDNLRTDGMMNVRDRTNRGGGHGWAGAQTMFWNCQSSGPYYNEISSPPGAINWAVGFTGRIRGDGWHESRQKAVLPRSLYLTQLEARLGRGGLDNVSVPTQRQGQMWDALSAWKGEGSPLWLNNTGNAIPASLN